MEHEPFEDANFHTKMNFHCLSVKVLLNHQLWAPWLLTPHHAGSQPLLACWKNTTWIWQVYDYCLGCPPTHPATVTSRRRSFLFEGSPIDLYFPLLIASSVSFKNATNPTYSPTNIPLSIEKHICSFVVLNQKSWDPTCVCVHNLSSSRVLLNVSSFKIKGNFHKPLIFRGLFRPRIASHWFERPFGRVMKHSIEIIMIRSAILPCERNTTFGDPNLYK